MYMEGFDANDKVLPNQGFYKYNNDVSPEYDLNTVQPYFDDLLIDLKNIVHQQHENTQVSKMNTYAYKKYKSQNAILAFIIIVCVIIILLSLIQKRYPYFDETAYIITIGIILGLSIIYITMKIINIYMRDDTNFDEIDFGGIINYDASANQELQFSSDISFNCDSSMNSYIKNFNHIF